MKIPLGPGGSIPDAFKLLQEPVGKALPTFVQKEGYIFSGRVKDPEIFEITRLDSEEAEKLKERAPNGEAPVDAYVNLRARHHEIARLMAAGVADRDISEGVGCSIGHLRTLRKSPAFANLLFGYMHSRDQVAFDFMARIKAAGGAALEELMDRILNNPQDISNDVLRQIAFGLLDRAGYGPVTKNQSVTLGLTADDIKDLKNANRAGTLTIDAKVVDAGEEASTEPVPSGTGGEPIQETASQEIFSSGGGD